MPENNKPTLLNIALETLERAAERLDAVDLRTIREYDLKQIRTELFLGLTILHALIERE